jgi:isocitrate dehydrogenase
MDLSQKSKTQPASTTQFAEGIIKHLDPKATQEVVNVQWDFKPKHVIKPKNNEMMASPAPHAAKTVGIDIFVDSDLLPHLLAEKIKAGIKSTGLNLVMISNRGTVVWPNGSVFTQCVNHYRCRLQVPETVPDPQAEAEIPASESDMLKIVSDLVKGQGVRVCSLEMLRVIDGLKKFTLAQGQ